LLRDLARAVAILTSWLLTLIAFYWIFSGGGTAAVVSFILALIVSLIVTSSSFGEGEA